MRVNHFFNFTYTLALSDFTTMGIYYFDNNNTIFWLHLWHAEVPGTGIEPVTQLQPQPQQWQWWILNLLCHKRTPPKIFFLIFKNYTGSSRCGTIGSVVSWELLGCGFHGCSLGHNHGSDLIPGPGAPYAEGWPKMTKKKKYIYI